MSDTLQRQPKSTKTLMRWFWTGYLRQSTPALFGAFGFMAIEGVMLGALSYLIKPMFDTIIADGCNVF